MTYRRLKIIQDQFRRRVLYRSIVIRRWHNRGGFCSWIRQWKTKAMMYGPRGRFTTPQKMAAGTSTIHFLLLLRLLLLRLLMLLLYWYWWPWCFNHLRGASLPGRRYSAGAIYGCVQWQNDRDAWQRSLPATIDERRDIVGHQFAWAA